MSGVDRGGGAGDPDCETLGLTDRDLAYAGTQLREKVLPHFGASVELVQTDPRADLGEIDDQRGEQSVTLLHSLGYLPEPPAGEEHCWSAEAIRKAWADWRSDWLAWSASADGERDVVLDLGTEALGSAEDNNAALRALKACATLEGEVTLRRWPVAGRTTLASRIALYRLRLYGLTDAEPGVALSPTEEAKLLGKARALMANRPALPAYELINRLGNLPSMTDELIAWVDNRFVLLATREQAAAAHLEETRLLDTKGKTTIKLLSRSNAGACALNGLTLRVLQVRLWTLGYYDGVIDGDWKGLSERALLDFAHDFELERTRTWIGAAADGLIVLDATKVLRCFRSEVDAVAEQTEREAIDEALAEAERRKGKSFWDALAKARAEDRENATTATYSYDGQDNVVATGKNVRRVRYFGWRGIFAAFGRFLRKAGGFARLVIAVARDRANRLRGLLRNIARYVADATRVAVRVAALGVQRVKCWLTGTPVVTLGEAHIVATFWQQDFDTVNVIAEGCPAELVARHGQVLDWMQRSLEAMLRVGLAIAQALLALGNWLLFAWRALLVVRQILREVADPSLKELVSETAPI